MSQPLPSASHQLEFSSSTMTSALHNNLYPSNYSLLDPLLQQATRTNLAFSDNPLDLSMYPSAHPHHSQLSHHQPQQPSHPHHHHPHHPHHILYQTHQDHRQSHPWSHTDPVHTSQPLNPPPPPSLTQHPQYQHQQPFSLPQSLPLTQPSLSQSLPLSHSLPLSQPAHTPLYQQAPAKRARSTPPIPPSDRRVGKDRVERRCSKCGTRNHIRKNKCSNCAAPKDPPKKRKRRRRRTTAAHHLHAFQSPHPVLQTHESLVDPINLPPYVPQFDPHDVTTSTSSSRH